MKSPEDNDGLKDKLTAWRLETEFRPDFNRDVWRKIATSKAVQHENYWQNLFAALFVTPRFATFSALAVAILTLSLGTASLAARTVTPEVESAFKEYAALEEDCRQAMLGHIYEVSAVMPGERFPLFADDERAYSTAQLHFPHLVERQLTRISQAPEW